MAAKQDDFDWVWGFAIALIVIVVLHQPGLSLQGLLIGSRTLSLGAMALLKFVSGFATSLLIVGICAGLVKRLPSARLIWGAVVTQILWLEIEWGFSFAFRGLGELLVRFAEEAGTFVSALALLVSLRTYSALKHIQKR